MEQAELDKQSRTGRQDRHNWQSDTRILGQNCLERSARTGLLGKDCQDRAARIRGQPEKGQLGQCSPNSTASVGHKEGQAEQGCHDKTSRTGPGCQDKAAGAELLGSDSKSRIKRGEQSG